MKINDQCIACLECLPYCPQGAIKVGSEEQAFIDSAECVECGVCADSGVCPVSAIEETDDLISNLKKQFGRLVSSLPGSKKVGRSGEFDVKTNDVTRSIPPDVAGLRLEINRPGGGARLRDVEGLRIFLEKNGWKPEIGARYRTVLEQGLTPEILDMKILTAVFEMKLPPSDLGLLLTQARDYLDDSPLYASVNIACRSEIYRQILKTLAGIGLMPDSMAKFNLGLGRKLS